MHWNALLDEVLKKKSEQKLPIASVESKQKIPKMKYYLGLQENNEEIYFTSREAEVMIHLLYGQTLNSAAANLKLSPRTIEYYVKNMKAKLECRTKAELISKVFGSEFMKYVNFIASALGR